MCVCVCVCVSLLCEAVRQWHCRVHRPRARPGGFAVGWLVAGGPNGADSPRAQGVRVRVRRDPRTRCAGVGAPEPRQQTQVLRACVCARAQAAVPTTVVWPGPSCAWVPLPACSARLLNGLVLEAPRVARPLHVQEPAGSSASRTSHIRALASRCACSAHSGADACSRRQRPGLVRATHPKDQWTGTWRARPTAGWWPRRGGQQAQAHAGQGVASVALATVIMLTS